MPKKERVRELVAAVERGDTLAAIEEFYAEDASMQENAEPPRVGLKNLLEHERKLLSHIVSMSARAVSWLVDGDQVAIHWVFEMQLKGRDAPNRLDEIALQHWQADKIVRERFFYDPASLRRQ